MRANVFRMRIVALRADSLGKGPSVWGAGLLREFRNVFRACDSHGSVGGALLYLAVFRFISIFSCSCGPHFLGKGGKEKCFLRVKYVLLR